MLELIKLTEFEFRKRQARLDLILGEKESNSPNFYEISYKNGLIALAIGVINNFPNMDLDPQVEIKDNQIVIGNDRTLTIIDVITKEKNEYPVFPVFYKFFIRDERIIVMSELVIYCLIKNEIAWELSCFNDMIEFIQFDQDYLTISTFEDRKKYLINTITGKIINVK